MPTPEEIAAAEAKAKADKEAADKAAADAAAKLAADKAAADAAPKDAAYWEKEAKAAFAKRDEAANKLKELSPKAAEYDKIVEAQKTEQQKATEALARVAKLEEENKSHVGTIQAYYDAEVAEIPEDKRTLIPDLPLAKKLEWLKSAKAQGLFGEPGPTTSARKPAGSASPTTMKSTDYMALEGKAFEEAAAKVAKGEIVIVG